MLSERRRLWANNKTTLANLCCFFTFKTVLDIGFHSQMSRLQYFVASADQLTGLT